MKEAPAKSAAVSAPAVPAGATVVGFDPSALNELKDQIAALSTELAKMKADLEKSVGASVSGSEKAIKQDLQRVEKNARSFQDGGMTRFDSIDKTVAAEVRKVRETLRKGISNDTQDLKAGIASLSSASIATLVINILVLVVVIIVMVASF